MKPKTKRGFFMFSELYLTKIALQKQLPAGSYLADLPVLRHLASVRELPLTRRVTFLVGENGTGKSTLLEAVALAMGFNPEGGSINFRFSTSDSHSQLFSLLTVGKGVSRPKNRLFPSGRELLQRRLLSRHASKRGLWCPRGLRRRLAARAVSRGECSFPGAAPFRPKRPVSARRARGGPLPHASACAALPHPRAVSSKLPVCHLHPLPHPHGTPGRRNF